MDYKQALEKVLKLKENDWENFQERFIKAIKLADTHLSEVLETEKVDFGGITAYSAAPGSGTISRIADKLLFNQLIEWLNISLSGEEFVKHLEIFRSHLQQASILKDLDLTKDFDENIIFFVQKALS